MNSLPWINQQNEIVFEYLLRCVLGIVAPSGITILIYKGFLGYINTKKWKKRFPQYDIDGEWKDTTKYTVMFDEKGYENIEEKQVPSPVMIKQTCKDIKIKLSVGEDFTWNSLMADFEEGKLMIFYEVAYNDSLQRNGFPESRYGYEEMVINTSELMPNEKPSKMSGHFWHCVKKDFKPMYMGDVIYERSV